MPITINGSGTLTGISAGGYPDATVTADDLAATLDLSSKTVTLPSGTGGKVVQVVSVVDTDQLAVSSNTWTTYTQAQITPSSSSNKILIMHNVTYGGVDNSYAGGQCHKSATGITDGFIDTGTNIHFTETNRFSESNYSLNMNASANDQYKMFQGHFYFLDTAGTTNQITYSFNIKADLSNRTAYINRGNANPGDGYNARPNTVTTLMEISV
tara:strand:+ start:1458 stop:2093 length:636 start_codon:yes stop_codon:yes gene_type:complete